MMKSLIANSVQTRAQLIRLGFAVARKHVCLALVLLLWVVWLAGCASEGAGSSTPIPPATPDPTPVAVATDVPRRGGKLVMINGAGTPRHFNAALVSGAATTVISAQIFASPLRYDEEWNPLPYLARSWEISDDGLAVTLHLVEGATFHDGRPITAEDVAFSVMTVKTFHPFKSMFAPVEQVDTPDPLTVVIRLSRPHPAILLAMSPVLLPILPKHIYGDGQNILTHPANLEPVGSGPFKFVRYTPGESLILERFEDYFIPGRPYLDQIRIELEVDPAAQGIALERQEIQLLPAYPIISTLDRLHDVEHLTVIPGAASLGPLNWLAFNLLRSPLDDRRVRQAIAYAVDPDFIIAYLHQGKTQRATGPIAPNSPFYTSDVHIYDLDLDKANQLLDEAGYLRSANGTRFSLTLDYIPSVPTQQKDVALYLDSQLAKIGIDVQVKESTSFPEWATRIGNWDFDMTMDSVFNWGDPVIGVHRTYLSDNIRQGMVWSNTQNYSNPRVDEILAQAEQEMDPVKRNALYVEFQQILTEDVPIVWINVMPLHTIYHTGLGNPPLSIWGTNSPLDEIFWKEPVVKQYLPIPSLTSEDPPLKSVGVRALRLLQEQNLYSALELFRDPDQGFLELEDSGLHLLGFTRAGTVFMDNSGQTKPGMDISRILDTAGQPVLPQLWQAAIQPQGGTLTLAGVWPHPTTQSVGTLAAWCALLTQEDVICALAWPSGEAP